jgi:hypothetical protein
VFGQGFEPMRRWLDAARFDAYMIPLIEARRMTWDAA